LLEQVAESARQAGAKVHSVVSDLSTIGVAAAIVDDCRTQFGRLDRIVSNAGFALAKPVGELTRAEFDHSHQVIAGAFLELVTAALPLLRLSDSARVVAVSSFVVDQVPDGRLFPATSSAKGALQSLALSFAAQVAAEGITVNCVAPGFTKKESAAHSALSATSWKEAAAMTPNRRLAMPVDIAHAIEFFLSDKAGHITGQTLRVDGGLSLV
jgi:NAD(P)-dependent dehydrogenase (short-subunit alcohol dehydrogenase family)